MISIANLFFGYRKMPLFSDLTMAVDQADVYGLLGRNGAGKSSLLRLISGMLAPQKGRCEVAGGAARRRSAAMLADMFFLPEEINLPAISGHQWAQLIAPFYPRFSHNQFHTYLQEFDVDIDSKLSSLSHGQQKKFIIAGGLAANVKLLLLDEPTNGLDIPSKSQFRKLIAGSVDDRSVVIISTHQVRDIETLIGQIILLEQGQIIFNHSLEEIAQRLIIEQRADKPDPGDCLHYEVGPLGYVVTRPNDGRPGGAPDLESLFNAVVAAPRAIEAIFTKGLSADGPMSTEAHS